MAVEYDAGGVAMTPLNGKPPRETRLAMPSPVSLQVADWRRQRNPPLRPMSNPHRPPAMGEIPTALSRNFKEIITFPSQPRETTGGRGWNLQWFRGGIQAHLSK